MRRYPTRRQFAAAVALGLSGCTVLAPGEDGDDTTPTSGVPTASDRPTTTGGTSTPAGLEDSALGGENFVFVTENELIRQKRRVESGEQPWRRAYDDLLEDADRALERGLRAVTDDDDDHDFAKDPNDGESAPDYSAAMQMSKAARDCGLAYWFTRKDRYAKHTVRVIHHWTLNEDTYMNPTVDVENNQQTIRQHITIPAFVYGASFVRGHHAWDQYDGSKPWESESAPDAEAAFEEWLIKRHGTFLSVRPGIEVAGWCEYNNKWAWRIVDRAATAAYLRNDEQMRKARRMWRAEDETNCDRNDRTVLRPWADFRNSDESHAFCGTAEPAKNGYFEHELGRGPAFNYTAYNLKAMTSALLVFERYDGTSMWEFNAPPDEHDGSSLWKAYNWFEEYVRDTSAWQWNRSKVKIGANNVEEATSTYELAYRHWGDFWGVLDDPDKLDGRPYYDRRVLGHVTLTHGEDGEEQSATPVEGCIEGRIETTRTDE